MIKKGMIIGLVLILLISVISAEILISQPNPLYSLGDTINLELEVDAFQAGYFDVDILCGDVSENLYHGILNKKKIKISRELIPLYIGNASGTCKIKSTYGVSKQSSQNFIVSNKIDVKLDIDETSYIAGEEIIIKGTATKENGELVGLNTAFVEIKLGDDLKLTEEVKNGQFKVNFSTQETMPARKYDFILKVYDKDEQGNVLNIGKKIITLTIIQEPDYIEIAIDKQFIDPGKELNIVAFLKDRAEEIMEEELIIVIKDVKDIEFYNEMINSGEEFSYYVPFDQSAGKNIILIKYKEIVSEKLFEIGELEKVEVKIDSNTLTIINVGNIDYIKPLDVELGSKTITLDINLKKGEKVVYSLSAPTGEYEVKIKDGEEILGSNNVALTGNTINIKEVNSTLGIWAKYSIAWIFILCVLGMVAFVMYKNNSNKNAYSFPVEKKETIVDKPKTALNSNNNSQATVLLQEKKIDKNSEKGIRKGEQVLVMHGEKQDAGIIAIKIKNQLTNEANSGLKDILKKVYNKKGVTSVNKEYIFSVFSPLLTKSLKNQETAIKVALEIDNELQEYNKKFKDKIEYNIGVNAGEIINKIEGDVLKYTSLGPTLHTAKKVADMASTGMLISKEAKIKAAPNVKTEKVNIEGEVEVFSVTRIINREKNKKFVRDFLERNKESK